MSLALRPVPPFDLSLSLAFLRGFGPMAGEQSATATSLIKAFDLGGQAVAVRVRQKGDRERPTLDVNLYSERALGAGLWRQVLARVRALLSTDEDLAPFHALAAANPAMAPLFDPPARSAPREVPERVRGRVLGSHQPAHPASRGARDEGGARASCGQLRLGRRHRALGVSGTGGRAWSRRRGAREAPAGRSPRRRGPRDREGVRLRRRHVAAAWAHRRRP